MSYLTAGAEISEFWGTVFPSYLGAVSGILSAVVGLIALILSLRNRGSVQMLAGALNASQRAAAGGIRAAAMQTDAVTWDTHRDGKNYSLTNGSSTRSALLTGIAAGDGGGAVELPQPLPTRVGSGGSVPFTLKKNLVSAAVTAIRIDWTEDDHSDHSATLYL